MQFVALLVLLLILFPVISVTDDLQVAQNPAEPDCCLRRDHVVSNAHSVFPAVAALPAPVFAEFPLAILYSAVPGDRPVRVAGIPALDSIQSRPPPVA